MRTSTTGRRDEPLHSDADTGPDAVREIESVVTLLRSLPDPQPSSDLTARVMRSVIEIEARPRLLRPVFGRSGGTRVAAALAAGIACAAVGIRLHTTRVPATEPAIGVASAELAARAGRAPRLAPGVAVANRFAMASAYADPRTAALFSGSTSGASLSAFPVVATPAPNLLERRLDAQLNELQLDPQAFFRRLERVRERDRFMQRLAERAAQRGDATQVALNVRAVSHPLVPATVDRLLHASLVQQVSDR